MSVFAAFGMSAGDGDGHEARRPLGAADEIDHGPAGTGDIEGKGAAVLEFGAADESADAIKHFGIIEAEKQALQVTDGKADCSFP